MHDVRTLTPRLNCLENRVPPLRRLPSRHRRIEDQSPLRQREGRKSHHHGGDHIGDARHIAPRTRPPTDKQRHRHHADQRIDPRKLLDPEAENPVDHLLKQPEIEDDDERHRDPKRRPMHIAQHPPEHGSCHQRQRDTNQQWPDDIGEIGHAQIRRHQVQREIRREKQRI